MKNEIFIPYREYSHGSIDDEWLPHRKVSGWWYITGYLNDKDYPENLYTYQYTMLRARVYGVTVAVLQLAFTDFQTSEHFLNSGSVLERSHFIQMIKWFNSQKFVL